MLKRKDGSANRGAAVYAYGKFTDFWASIKIVTNLQKIFKKVQKSSKKLLTLYGCGDIIIKSSANSERHENKTSSRGGIGIRARLRI